MAHTTPSGYPRIRFPNADWEYDTYANFKVGMRDQAENQSRENALRNEIPHDLFSNEYKYDLEIQIKELIKYLKPLAENYENPYSSAGIKNRADVLTDSLNKLIKDAKGAGYLNMPTINKIKTVLKQLNGGNINNMASRSSNILQGPNGNLMQLVQMLNNRVVRTTLADKNNLGRLFEDTIKKSNLPEGVRLSPSFDRKSAEGAARAASNLISMTMTPRTASTYRVDVGISKSGAPTMGRKYSRLPVKLGQLTQGLSQINFFGSLRYWYYSTQAEQTMKAYLAARYLRLFANKNPEYPLLGIQPDGTLYVFNEQNLINRVEKLSALGSRGAHYNTILKAQREGLSPSSIAIRTWIENKNIKPTMEIPGFIRFSPGNFFPEVRG